MKLLAWVVRIVAKPLGWWIFGRGMRRLSRFDLAVVALSSKVFRFQLWLRGERLEVTTFSTERGAGESEKLQRLQSGE